MPIRAIFLVYFTLALPLSAFGKVYSANKIVGKKVTLDAGTPLYEKPSVKSKEMGLSSQGSIQILERVSSTTNGQPDFYRLQIGKKDYFISADDLTEAGFLDCEACRQRARLNHDNKADLKAVAKAAGGGGGQSQFQSLSSLPGPNKGGFAPACSKFVRSDGSIGPLGAEFLEAASEVQVGSRAALDYLMSPGLWTNACPNFGTFSPDQKKHFLATFIAVKAMDEASCNGNAINWNTPNPPGIGFFMMEGSASKRNGRSRLYCGGGLSGVQESLPTKLQFTCVASIIVNSQYNTVGPFCGGAEGYWQEANSKNGDICKSLRKYKACFN